MANRTDPAAKSIRGTNPQNLVEKILRSKIYQNTYWKEQCFGLTAETLVDKAMELDHLGGTFGGNRKPTPFMCLVMKMLQIQPEKEIVIEFIKNDDYKYFLAPFISTNKIVSILIILFFLSNLIF
jgi:pre-mRNA-splicing factor 38A